MQRFIPRVLLLPVMMVLALLCFAAPASAADGWLPSQFDAQDRVYLDPALKNHPQYPVRLDGLEEKLDRLSAEQGIEFYFVYTLKSPTAVIPPQYGQEYAAWQLDDLVNRWSSKSGFPAKRAIVIMVVRSDRNANAFSIAANGGSDMQAYGFTKDFFAGGYLLNLRQQYLPNDMQGYVVAVADGANQKYADKVSSDAFKAALPMYILYFVIALALLGTFGFFWRRYAKAVAALKAELDEWAPKMNSVTTLFQTLNDPEKGYLDFLSNQKGRRASFTGETKAKYETALADYTAFVLRRQLAADLYLAAKKAFESRKFIVSTGALTSATESLTTRIIVITGQEKSLRDITDAFGGTVEQQKLNPDQLLDKINELFNAVNSALSSIMTAFERASANKSTITTTLQEVTDLQDEVEDAGLTFTPFSTRAQAINAEAQAVLADITANPIGKLRDSSRLNDLVVDLKGDIEKCIAIKGALPETLRGIETVRGRVATVRDTATGLAYPLVKGEEAGTEAAPKFLLAEQGNNPDGKLAEADTQAATCERELQAGEWEKAQAAKEAAEAAAKAANQLVDNALAAKAYVETHVPKARAHRVTVDGKLPAARQAADTLKGEFLAANFAGQTEKVTTAETVTEGTEEVIDEVRSAYYRQDFDAARATLAKLEGSISSAEAGLADVHAKLAELQKLRSHARTTAADAVTKSAALKTKRNEKSFTTSAATDSAHKGLTPKVATLKVNVEQDVADWPALAAEADTLVASLVALDKQVDASERAYADAQQKVAAVASAVEDAARACGHDDVLQPAKDKLAEAQRTLRQLKQTLETEKSDWARLAEDANAKRTIAKGAKESADQDVEDAKDARNAIRSAATLLGQADTTVSASKVGGYKRQTFRKTVNVDLSKAEAALASARSALGNRQWKKAKEHADSVGGKIDSAERAAKTEADRQVQAAIVIWIQQNPEPRPDPTPSYRGGSNDSGGFSGGGFSGGFSDSSSSTGNSGGSTDNGF
jgi:uncharacterized membrane protein YgcG